MNPILSSARLSSTILHNLNSFLNKIQYPIFVNANEVLFFFSLTIYSRIWSGLSCSGRDLGFHNLKQSNTEEFILAAIGEVTPSELRARHCGRCEAMPASVLEARTSVAVSHSPNQYVRSPSAVLQYKYPFPLFSAQGRYCAKCRESVRS